VIPKDHSKVASRQKKCRNVSIPDVLKTMMVEKGKADIATFLQRPAGIQRVVIMMWNNATAEKAGIHLSLIIVSQIRSGSIA